MTTLESLSGQRWGEVAQRRLEHNRRLISDFKALKQSEGGAAYAQQLLAFYTALDAQQDSYFLYELEEAFQVHRKKALDEAQKAFVAARGAWEEYRSKGGIRGVQRLEASVLVGGYALYIAIKLSLATT